MPNPVATLAALAILSVGCDVGGTAGEDAKDKGGEAPAFDPAAEGGGGAGAGAANIQVPALGVDIQGEGSNWAVRAPGARVRVDGGEVEVEAAGTRVSVRQPGSPDQP